MLYFGITMGINSGPGGVTDSSHSESFGIFY